MSNKIDEKEERDYKVTIYDNERLRVQYNTYNPFENRTILNFVQPPKIRNYKWPYMTTKQYARQLKQGKKKCANLKLQADKCVFLTLTTKELFCWEQIKVKFNSFIRSVKRNFGKIYFVRAFESFEKEIHYHIHLIIMFENEKPINFTEQWVQDHWKHGFSDFQYVIEPYGILDYITNYKKSNIHLEANHFTKFPQFVKIVTRSLDFPKSNTVIVNTNENGVKDLLKHYNRKCKKQTGQDLFCYNDGHYYIDYDTGEYAYCLDNQYYHKPFIEEI